MLSQEGPKPGPGWPGWPHTRVGFWTPQCTVEVEGRWRRGVVGVKPGVVFYLLPGALLAAPPTNVALFWEFGIDIPPPRSPITKKTTVKTSGEDLSHSGVWYVGSVGARPMTGPYSYQFARLKVHRNTAGDLGLRQPLLDRRRAGQHGPIGKRVDHKVFDELR